MKTDDYEKLYSFVKESNGGDWFSDGKYTVYHKKKKFEFWIGNGFLSLNLYGDFYPRMGLWQKWKMWRLLRNKIGEKVISLL